MGTTTRTIEVYAKDPRDAVDAAIAYARDDMGCGITIIDRVTIKRDAHGTAYEPDHERFIYQVSGELVRLRGDASDPAVLA